jgi:AmiR/NasT family two-component response regulator
MRAFVVVGESDDDAKSLREALHLAGCQLVPSLDSAPDLVVMRADSYRRLQEALAEANRRLEERKLVERAKGLLMKTRGLDEDAAYTLLRKLAMNRKLRLGELAQQLIDAAAILDT